MDEFDVAERDVVEGDVLEANILDVRADFEVRQHVIEQELLPRVVLLQLQALEVLREPDRQTVVAAKML